MSRKVNSVLLCDVFDRLLSHYGPQHWWPAASDFEMMVGAILVQNTSWKNAAKSTEDLRTANLLDVRRMHECSDPKLEVILKSCGYFRLKTKRLKSLVAYLLERCDGHLERLWRLDAEMLRSELLSVHGIGPETADSIILYGARKPRFVVDKYTWRLLVRHGWIDRSANYDDMQQLFERNLPGDDELFNEYHALIVRVGNERCRTTPRCEGCPLEGLLPKSGACRL